MSLTHLNRVAKVELERLHTKNRATKVTNPSFDGDLATSGELLRLIEKESAYS